MRFGNPFAINRAGREAFDPVNPLGDEGNGFPELNPYNQWWWSENRQGGVVNNYLKTDSRPLINLSATDGDPAYVDPAELMREPRYFGQKTAGSDLTQFDIDT